MSTRHPSSPSAAGSKPCQARRRRSSSTAAIATPTSRAGPVFFMARRWWRACARPRRQIRRIACPYPDDDRWHFVAVIVDSEHATVRAVLDGDPAGWHASDIESAARSAGRWPCRVDRRRLHRRGGRSLQLYLWAQRRRLYRRSAHLPAGADGGRDRRLCAGGRPCAACPLHLARAPGNRRAGPHPLRSNRPGAGATCLWHWSDGERAIGQTVERDFAYAGSYGVRLDVIDAEPPAGDGRRRARPRRRRESAARDACLCQRRRRLCRLSHPQHRARR